MGAGWCSSSFKKISLQPPERVELVAQSKRQTVAHCACGPVES